MAALLSRTCWCSRPRSRWGAPNHALQRTAGHSFFSTARQATPAAAELGRSAAEKVAARHVWRGGWGWIRFGRPPGQ